MSLLKDVEDKRTVLKEVLSYWQTLDFLSQDVFPKYSMTEANKSKQILEKDPKSKDYKQVKIFIQMKENGKSIYEIVKDSAQEHNMSRWGDIILYIGKIKRECCIAKIAEIIKEPDDSIEINDEKIAWASFQLTSDLMYVEKTFSISPVLWATRKLKENVGEKRYTDILRRSKYNSDVTEYDCELNSICKEGKKKREGEGKKRKIDNYDLDDKREYIKENAFSISREKIVEIKEYLFQIYVEDIIKNSHKNVNQDMESGIWLTFKLYKDDEAWDKGKDEEYHGLSRSYFVDDLQKILGEIENLENGSAIHRKLGEYVYSKYAEIHGLNKEDNYIDLLKQSQESGGMAGYKNMLLNILDPGNAPVGKWPSRYMPSLMQQIAINLGIGEENTIFSVNGPPGTGKTTMLKEIVAHNVVERAKLLAVYDDPDDAFEHYEFKGGNKKANIYRKGGNNIAKNSYRPDVAEYHIWKNSKINDYSIVVTSNNNAAVENISKEFPMEHKLIGSLEVNESDSDYIKRELSEVKRQFKVSENPEADLFKRGAENFVGNRIKFWKGSKEEIEKKKEAFLDCRDIYFTRYARNLFDDENGDLDKNKAWGLIAAPLGNKRNVKKFYENVLYNFFYIGCTWKRELKKQRVQEYREIREKFKEQLKIVTDMQEKLKDTIEEEKRRKKEWAQQINKREQLEEQAEDLQKKLLEESEAEKKVQKALQEIVTEYDLKYEQYQESERMCSEVEEKYSDCYQKYMDTEQERARIDISFVGKLLKTRKAREAEEKYDVLSQRITFFQQEMERMESEKKDAEQERGRRKQLYIELEREKVRRENDLQKLKKNAGNIKEKIESNQVDLAICNEKINKLGIVDILHNTMSGSNNPDVFQWIDDKFVQDLLSENVVESTEAHAKNPWFSPRYNREREKLFNLALRLQEAFILASASCRENLISLAMYWKLKKDNDKDGEIVEFSGEDIKNSVGAMFQTLFLFVPVVSVTFASIGLFFRDVDEKNIGTLIVDEAGQAVPYMAVGALYRARKAIIVGDPRQIQPVVTDDLRILNKAFDKDPICRYYNVKDISVQTFADSLNKYGTRMEILSDADEWIGCPLSVHRRCIAPMFEISNELSYNNIMKQKTVQPNAAKQERFIFPKSGWIAVKGREQGGKDHFVKEQANKVLEMLEIAADKGGVDNIFIISPFKSVVYGMRGEVMNSNLRRRKEFDESNIEKWLEKHIGTVHTFQGKEADEVIFLLGCDSGKQAEGAIRFVTGNIVNVAATRAKYRLYVIGDDAAWRNSPALEIVLRKLDRLEC